MKCQKFEFKRIILKDQSINYNHAEIIRSPAAVYRAAGKIAAQAIGNEYKEHLIVLFLNARNKLTGYNLIGVGTQTANLVDPGEIYRAAIMAGAQSIIISHNHPSGDTEPSDEDIAITQQVKDAGKLLNIQLKDHVIVSENKFYSFKENGRI